MSVTEAERAALRTALTEEIGAESADVLMRSTLPRGSDQLATKDDIDLIRTRVEGEFAKVHGKLDSGFARVHGEFAKVHGKLDSGSGKVHGKLDKAKETFQEHKFLLTLSGVMVTIWVALVVAAIVLTS